MAAALPVRPGGYAGAMDERDPHEAEPSDSAAKTREDAAVGYDCPECQGRGEVDGEDCLNCGGTGKALTEFS